MKIKLMDIVQYTQEEKLLYSIDFPRIGSINEYNAESLLAGWCFVNDSRAISNDVVVIFKNELMEKKIYLSESRLDVKNFLAEKKMLNADSFGCFGFSSNVKLGIKNDISVKFNNNTLLTKTFFSVFHNNLKIIIGHSSSGKSAVLNHMQLDRWLYDADVYFLKSKKERTIENLIAWLSYPREHDFVVLCNDYELLKDIAKLKKLFSSHQFIYVKRPFEIYKENIVKVNTDGIYHDVKDLSKMKLLYDRFDALYEIVADSKISYNGYDLSELSNLIFSNLIDG